ncbi:MAG: outer membrane protein assembly factor BamA [Gammaproteobacteria bacterium]|nr:outer membrane protein assembly factor BamA [Gammaproteobacteria bacterium]
MGNMLPEGSKTCLFRSILSLLVFAVVACESAAQEFIIEDIRVEGLQRLTPGTVFNYLPLEVGDAFTPEVSSEAVSALFKTGFFDDVQLKRDGNVLVIVLKERAAIGSIEISGNKDIKTEDLLDGLNQIGFAEGRVFDQSQLDGLERELRRQYFSAGKYAVNVNSEVTPLSSNRVAVSIDISEGKAARIKQINIVGNRSYREEDLLDDFELSEPTLLSFFTKDDQYSRQKLSGDLETLRSFYLDRGYVNFSIDSTQVSITPDKKDIYITINITEGGQYTVSGVKLAGEFILPEERLYNLISVTQGSLFSRKQVTDSSERMTDRLGASGYAFANVNSIPDIDEDENTVEVTFFVDPGKRVYVRRINFSGNTRTRDEVLRREMRQHEGGWISTPKIERGKIRLQRLGFFEEVNVETPAVAGSADQVDVDYTVTEKPFGNFLAGLGFSQNQGLIFQTSITQDNFLGSGKRIQFAFNNSDINRRFALGYVNPYYTVDGISRGFNVNYQETEAYDANITAFDSRVIGAGVSFGVPVTEYNFISTAFGYENTRLSEDRFFAEQVRDFIDREGSKFDILRLSAAFSYDTRNRAILPTRGIQHRFSSEMAVPSFGNSLEFFKIGYRTQWYHPVLREFIFTVKGDFGYGNGLFGTDELPFFENFYAGGPRSVRGYEENTLGPKDTPVHGGTRRRPLGGNIKVIGGAEMIFPLPFLKEFKQVRFAAFFDGGNVYSSDESFEFSELRYSTGLSGIWISPFGLVSVSIARPIGDQEGDETQPFQFTFGSTF